MFLLDRKRLNYLTVRENELKYLMYMYENNLALNNQQWLICHKTKPNQK